MTPDLVISVGAMSGSFSWEVEVPPAEDGGVRSVLLAHVAVKLKYHRLKTVVSNGLATGLTCN